MEVSLSFSFLFFFQLIQKHTMTYTHTYTHRRRIAIYKNICSYTCSLYYSNVLKTHWQSTLEKMASLTQPICLKSSQKKKKKTWKTNATSSWSKRATVRKWPQLSTGLQPWVTQIQAVVMQKLLKIRLKSRLKGDSKHTNITDPISRNGTENKTVTSFSVDLPSTLFQINT